MALNAPPLVFTSETTGSVVRLEGVDVPKPDIQWGGKYDKTVTRYPGGESSVQVHGIEHEPKVLEGRFDDAKKGIEGHALVMKNNCEGLMAEGGVVRLDYGGESQWGTFEVVFEEKRRDRIKYKITFTPYWDRPPEVYAVMNFEAPPQEDAFMVISVMEVLEQTAKEPPTSVEGAPLTFDNGTPHSSEGGTSFALEAYLLAAAALNKHAEAMGALDEFVSYAEMGAKASKFVQRRMLGSLGAVERLLARLKTAGASVYTSEDGVERLKAERWAADMERHARLIRADVLAMIRRFIEGVSPSSSRTYVVGQGDTLTSIARRMLGDWSRWTEIADANDLDNALAITVGQVLDIPPR